MAYILAVNPSILSAAGMDSGAVFTATALASFIATLLMAGLSNYPFALAPGMGLNAYFAYTVVLNMGYTWEMALAAVFLEGLIFIALSLTSVRESIFNAIPMNLKHAVSVGIGLFIAFIGLQNAKVVVDGATLVSVFSFKSSLADGSFHTVGITVLLAIIGILITAVLVVRKVKGNILWGIIITWILGMLCQVTGLYQPDPELGMFSVFPDFSSGFGIRDMSPTFLKLDFSKVLSLNFLVVMFAFLFVDMFDTLGTLIGVASKADMLDKDGKLPRIKGALMSDAVGTSVGALLGTSTTTTFVESASGVAEGGRTGLTSVVTAILFGLSLFLSPFFLAIPSFATAPALVVVGFLMMTSVTKIDFTDYTEAIPSYIAIIAMPFMYSISEGISMGVISYVVINLATGNAKKKKISVIMYVLAVLFVLKYILV
jgi:AGZA family xanthine/uracil permease-like MFS transporter